MRGIAVLLMIEAHTLDAWTASSVRSTAGFRDATILGGFAAPLFLWLAGVAVALSAATVARRTGNRAAAVDAVCRRGLEIFVLAFVFRLQAFIVSPGSHAVTLFRVDILNIMGPAMTAAGVVWGLFAARTALVGAYAGLALGFAMLTPIVRTAAFVDRLPTWIAWYLRPAGEHTTFTAFPWVGFVFAGAACGVLLTATRDEGGERRLHAGLGLAGLALLVLGLYAASRPSLYSQSSFWTSSPTYFAARVAILMLASAGMYAVARHAAVSRVLRPLEKMGRSSLFVYWIHVELVYGYATWAIHRRLPLWGTAMAYAAFCALMYATIALRDHLVGAWRDRRRFQAEVTG